MTLGRILRTTGVVVLAVGTVSAITGLVVRDQIARSQRDLFSPHPLRRLAALGYIAGRDASVELVQVLRDFIGWELKPLLRRRARQVLQRMEVQLLESESARTRGLAG
jgi:hypothetical protein